VEIGGGFRIPDVMRQSGAALVEVGTTNRTYARDYEAAIEPETAALLKVHSSNFRVVGFTHEATIAELAALGRQHDLPLINDLGSGALRDTAAFGIGHEPTVDASVRAGAAVTLFSGDKLLGGPQSGIVVGDRLHIETIARHPLARAFRLRQGTLAGLAETLRHYLRGEELTTIPIWRMIAVPKQPCASAPPPGRRRSPGPGSSPPSQRPARRSAAARCRRRRCRPAPSPSTSQSSPRAA
jgi:L-seryl-tRNA(Ser) seleniumtransferase